VAVFYSLHGIGLMKAAGRETLDFLGTTAFKDSPPRP